MASFTPSAADYEYVLQNDPYAFASPSSARTVLNHIRATPNTDVQERLQALNNNYTQGGNAPMTASPRGGPGADPKFGGACVDCKPNEPCCLKSGIIYDAKDPSRKLEWPVSKTNPKKRILIVAKDVTDGKTTGKLKLKGEGKACRASRANKPGFVVNSPSLNGVELDLRESDLTVGFNASFGSALALADFVPPKVLYALMIMDMIVSSAAQNRGRQPMRVTPIQCMSDGPMRQVFEAVPVPYFKLEASATAEIALHVMTTGVGAAASLKGNITGKYGAIDLTADAAATVNPSTGRRPPAQGTAPGFLGIIASVVKTLADFVTSTKEAGRQQSGQRSLPAASGAGTAGSPPEKVDTTDFGTGFKIDKSLKLTAGGIELKAKSGTPDLEAAIASFEVTLTMKVTGIVDFFDVAIVSILSPAGAKLAREARSKIADKDNPVRGEARCELHASAEGELKHTTESGLRVLIPAEGDAGFDRDKLNKEFHGKLTVLGRAEVLIHVEAEVWFVSAEAGASGQLHSGWTWEIKIDGEKKRKKRTYFDGLLLRAVGYARAGASSTKKNSAKTRDRGPDRQTTGSVKGTQTGPGVSVGDKDYRDPSKTASNPAGSVVTVFEPTVPKVTDFAPPWQDY